VFLRAGLFFFRFPLTSQEGIFESKHSTDYALLPGFLNQFRQYFGRRNHALFYFA